MQSAVGTCHASLQRYHHLKMGSHACHALPPGSQSCATFAWPSLCSHYLPTQGHTQVGALPELYMNISVTGAQLLLIHQEYLAAACWINHCFLVLTQRDQCVHAICSIAGTHAAQRQVEVVVPSDQHHDDCPSAAFEFSPLGELPPRYTDARGLITPPSKRHQGTRSVHWTCALRQQLHRSSIGRWSAKGIVWIYTAQHSTTKNSTAQRSAE